MFSGRTTVGYENKKIISNSYNRISVITSCFYVFNFIAESFKSFFLLKVYV